VAKVLLEDVGLKLEGIMNLDPACKKIIIIRRRDATKDMRASSECK